MTAVDHAELLSDLGYWESEARRLSGGQKLASEFTDVEWGYLKRSLSHSVALLSEIEGLKAERANAKPWQDRKDEWSEAISAAHPVNSDLPWRHECFETAMEMVGNRHGKYELVALVSWLLSDLQSLRTQAPDSWRAIETAPKDGDAILITRPTLFTAEERWHVVRWDEVDEMWVCHDGKFDSYLRGPDPTHWMPLPAAPALRPQTAESGK